MNKSKANLRTKLLAYLQEINNILEFTEESSRNVLEGGEQDPYCFLRKYLKLIYQDESPFLLTDEELLIFAKKMKAVAESKIKGSSNRPMLQEILLSRLKKLPLMIDLNIF